MRLLGIAMLGIIGAAIAGCGTTHNNRYYDSAYDHTAYDHQAVSHTPGYGEQPYYDANGDVVILRPANGAPVPNPPDRVMYDGYYYYRG
jgi:hypothetical protein